MYISSNISDFNGNLVIVKPLVEFIIMDALFIYNNQNASKQNLFKFFIRNLQNISGNLVWFINNSFNRKSREFFRFNC